MATFDNIVVRFLGDASGLVRASRRAARSLGRVTSQFARLVKLSALSAGGAATAAAGLVEIGRRQTDSTRQLAAELGDSVRNTQLLQLASRNAGVDIRTTANAVQRLERFVGDAADGNLNAKKTFERLGVSVKQLQSLSAVDRFRLILERLEGIDDNATQASIAAKLFEEQWRQLRPLIQGAEGDFDDAEFTIRRLRLGLDKSAKVSDLLNKRIRAVSNTISTLFLKVFEALEPFLAEFARIILAWSDSFIIAAGGGERLARVLAVEMLNAVSTLVGWVLELRDAFRGTGEFLENLIFVFGKFANFVVGAFKVVGTAAGAYLAILNQIRENGLIGGFNAATVVGQDLIGGVTGLISGGGGDERVQEAQLTEAEEQTRLLRRVAEGTFTNVGAVAQ